MLSLVIMSGSAKGILKFASLYFVLLLLSNILVGVLYNTVGWQIFPPIPGGYYSYVLLPFPTFGTFTAVLPPEMLAAFGPRFSCFGILLNILLFAGSFFIVFKKKVKLRTWATLFVILSLLVVTYFTFWK